MSNVLVSYLIDDAAMAVGDPNKTRISTAQWIALFNQAQRKLCEKTNVLKRRGIFDLSTSATYTWPAEMTVMTGLEVTDTPTDEESFRSLKESFEDEFRDETSDRYPVATVPRRYHATVGWYYLIPRPQVAIVGGGRLTYYCLPDRITTLTGAVLECPDFTQDYVIAHMVATAKLSLNRVVEARDELELWEKSVEGLQDKAADRSDDRPSTIAPRKNRLAGMN